MIEPYLGLWTVWLDRMIRAFSFTSSKFNVYMSYNFIPQFYYDKIK